MSFSGAFRRTVVTLAEKEGVAVHMHKWWKKLPRDGEITRTLSANEQNVVTPWIKTFPKKTLVRAPYYVYNLGITIGLTYFGYWYSTSWDENELYSHRY